MALISQVKTVDLILKILRGDFQHITPYEFIPHKKSSEGMEAAAGLEFSTPEREGVSSDHIRRFFLDLDECPHINIHSAVLLRHGKVIAQASWKPYSGHYPHMLFSLSKSITAMAVGMAVGDGLFSLDDKIVSFFPDKNALFRNPRIGAITVRHLLTMTAGVTFNEVGSFVERDWAKAYLQSDCAFDPGTDFYYNSMNTYMLSAILRRKTGVGLVDYLTPRLFEPLKIPVPVWETCPMGIEKGGWGTYLRPIDMAKLGQLYLQKGRWMVDGAERQLIPEEWVLASTAMSVKTNKEDIVGGYGYQLWSFGSKNAYQFNGVFGQYVIVLPEQDMVIAMTGGSKTVFTDYSCNIIAKYFEKEAHCLHSAPLTNDIPALRRLRQTCESLRVEWDTAVQQEEPPRQGFFLSRLKKPKPHIPPLARSIDGQEYTFEKNYCTLLPMIVETFTNNFGTGVEKISFSFQPGVCRVTVTEGGDTNTMEAGLDGEPRRSPVFLRGDVFTVGASARLSPDEDGRPVLKLYLSFLETPSTRLIKCIFYNDRMLLRCDELPSMSDASEMLFGLVGGDSSSISGLSKLLQDAISQQKLADRVKALMKPRTKGTLIGKGSDSAKK